METRFSWRMNQNVMNGTSISDIKSVESCYSGLKKSMRMEIHSTTKVLTLLQTMQNLVQEQLSLQQLNQPQLRKRRNKNQSNQNKKLQLLQNVNQKQQDQTNQLIVFTMLVKLSPLRKKKLR